MTMRRLRETLFRCVALTATAGLGAVLLAILATIVVKGGIALSIGMLTHTPSGGYYLGGGGGIANAIVGSLYLGVGATALALAISLPTVLYLRSYAPSWFAASTRFLLDVLWGVPSIVFGAFGFIVMVAMGLRASLLAGIITVALFELPIMIRATDEVVKMVPRELEEASYGVGATRFETAWRVVARQALPGIITGALLAFGRGVGDAASVLFTAGFTDRIPHSLLSPAATLPLAVFFQLATPFEAVHQRAYAAALVLVILVLGTGILARIIGARLGRHAVR